MKLVIILLKISNVLYFVVIFFNFCKKFLIGGMIFILLVIGFMIILVILFLNFLKVILSVFKLLYGIVIVFLVIFLGILGEFGNFNVVILDLVLINNELLWLW